MVIVKREDGLKAAAYCDRCQITFYKPVDYCPHCTLNETVIELQQANLLATPAEPNALVAELKAQCKTLTDCLVASIARADRAEQRNRLLQAVVDESDAWYTGNPHGYLKLLVAARAALAAFDAGNAPAPDPRDEYIAVMHHMLAVAFAVGARPPRPSRLFGAAQEAWHAFERAHPHLVPKESPCSVSS
jgi:hypothetical protein